MMTDPYRNLTESELIEADHYAETGNREGLRKMQERSASRNTPSVPQHHQTNREPQWD